METVLSTPHDKNKELSSLYCTALHSYYSIFLLPLVAKLIVPVLLSLEILYATHCHLDGVSVVSSEQ